MPYFIKTARWDGHTHTEFCPHGSKEKTYLMIEKAIAKKFTHYSITEHTPLPAELLSQKSTHADSAIKLSQLATYWEHISNLKKKYKNEIKIIGSIELDYLVGFEDYTQQFLTKYQAQLDEVVLSLHFLPTNNDTKLLKLIDQSRNAFEVNFNYLKIEDLYKLYWHTVLRMVSKEWNFKKRIRIAHLCLIEKYSKIFTITAKSKEKWISFIIDKILPAIAKQKYSLDFNVSGMRKPECGQVYFYTELLPICKQLKIPLVYGSDAHSIEDIATHYDLFQRID